MSATFNRVCRGDSSATLTPTTQIAVVELMPCPTQRWALLGAYVELVWVEALGVTTTAIARRVGHLLSEAAPRRAVSLDALAAPLRITASKALDVQRRLHHHGIIKFHEHSAVIGCSSRVADVDRVVPQHCRPTPLSSRARTPRDSRCNARTRCRRRRPRRSLGLEV
jgi:hypothetical protein